MKHSLRTQTLVTLMALLTVTANAQWTASILHPDGYGDCGAGFGVGDTIYGGATKNGAAHAGVFTQNGFESYNPPGAANCGISAVDGSHQFGVAYFGSEHAARWSGSAGSFEDWNPTGASASYIYTARGGTAGGYATFNGSQHATLWNGAGVDDLTDLHNDAWLHSAVDAIQGNDQFGDVTLANNTAHAGRWAGTAASFVDMNPIGALESQIIGATQGRQVGWSDTGNGYQATAWSGSMASAVNLNPIGYAQSIAYDVSGSSVAGTVWSGGDSHAGYWNADTQEFIDLQPFLTGYSASAAYGVQIYGGTVRVYGQAWNTQAERFDAVVWSQPVPEPVTRIALGLVFPLLAARRRSSGR